MKFLAIFILISVVGANGQTRKAPARKATAAPAQAAAPAPPADGAPFPIETLRVTGNQNYSADQILKVAGIRIGQTAGKADFEEAREKLVSAGAFDSVGYRFAPAKDGKGYDASFEVVEIAQVLPIHFEDLPVPDVQLKAWLQQKDPLFGPKIPATKLSLDRYVKWISEYLEQHEHREPVIARVVSENPPELSILFRPAKPRPTIAHVKFTNTGALPAGMLQTAMHGVAIGVSYTEQQYRLLLDTTVRPLYEARGMIRVSFGKVDTEPAKDVTGIVVTTDVNPGAVYKLAKVNFRGADSIAKEPLDKLAALKADQPVNFDDAKAAQERIAQSLNRSGFLQAASEVKRDVHDDAKTVDLTFQIAPGPQFTMGNVTIVGLDLESEPVIRKMWGLQPGKPFNIDYPNRFLSRVKEDGVFDNLKTTRAETKRNADHTVDVTLYFNK